MKVVPLPDNRYEMDKNNEREPQKRVDAKSEKKKKKS